MNNVISIDVEQWFHRPILKNYIKNIKYDSEHIVLAINKILKIFKKYNKTTTFFILGEVAEQHPELIKIIAEDGHELAWHGYTHKHLEELNPIKFKKELEKGTMVVKKMKNKIVGFRAPSFSLNKNTKWILPMIEKYGYRYDSSIFPVKTPLYGSGKAPTHPYNPSFVDPYSEDACQSKIIEFPILTRKIFYLRLPAGGGFYMRLFGVKFIMDSIKMINKEGYPAMCYFHPWEICGFPKIDLPFYKKFYAYYGIPCLDKFEKLIESVDISPAIELLESKNWVK